MTTAKADGYHWFRLREDPVTVRVLPPNNMHIPIVWPSEVLTPEARQALRDLVTQDVLDFKITHNDLSGREPRVRERQCSCLRLMVPCRNEGPQLYKARARMADAANFLVAHGYLQGQRHVLRYSALCQGLEWRVFVAPEHYGAVRGALGDLVFSFAPIPVPEAEWADEEL